MRLYRLALALAASIWSYEAGANCTREQAEEIGYIRPIIEAWEREQQTSLDPVFSDQLQRNTCSAVTRHGLKSDRGKDAVQWAIRRYLSGIASGKPTPHIGKMIQMALGYHSGVQPQARELGIVEFAFTRQVDTLIIRGSRVNARPKLLVATGALQFVGEWKGVRVCSGKALVLTGSKVQARC